MERVIVISAHPDDELLGAGGALLKHHSKGDEIFWLVVTHVFESEQYPKQFVKQRQNEISQVSKKLGVKKVFKLDYPTMTLHSGSLETMIPRIAESFSEIKPQFIYCPNRSDAHSDHRIVFDAVMACTKSFRHPCIKRVLMYECISETEFAPALPEKVFIPNYFVNITDFLQQKLELLKIYSTEIGEHPFPRSAENVKALATFRGASSGFKYAEAFQLIKYIDD